MGYGTSEMGNQWDMGPMRWGTSGIWDQWDGGPVAYMGPLRGGPVDGT